MLKIFDPLKPSHPLIKDKDMCPYCGESFKELERVTIIAPEIATASIIPGIPAHATCAFKGVKTSKGIISRIKDGDGSPYPVIMEDGKQYKLEEL